MSRGSRFERRVCGVAHGLKGVDVEVSKRDLVVRFEGAARCLSYAPHNGGLKTTNCLVNHKVEGDFCVGDVESEARRLIHSLGLPDDAVCFFTAADVEDYCLREVSAEGLHVLVLSTVGLTNSRSVGEGAASPMVSTINTFVVVDHALDDTGLANALASAVEAKALALFSLDVRSSTSGRLAVGTSSDALAVVTLGVGRPLRYAGTATAVGSAIGQAVYSCVGEGVRRKYGVEVLRRLTHRGVTPERLYEAAEKGVVGDFKPPKLRELFYAELENWLCDPNVCALLIAAMRLDDEGGMGNITGLSVKEYRGDTPRMLVDESIGEAIAQYIAGLKATNNFRHYDRLKPGVLSELPMFLDDALCALIAGIMTRIFDSAQPKPQT